MASGGITFPLPERFLPQVSLTQQEITQYRVAVKEIVAKTLDQEIDFRYRRSAKLEEDRWKFVKAKDRLKVYKRVAKHANANMPSTSLQSIHHVGPLAGHRRTSPNASAPKQPQVVPMVVCIGKIDGVMEDALYGVHHKTTDEMRITTAFLNKHHLDAAVLHTIDTGTDADPFRYLGIKWRIAETPGGNFISNRDVCVLEYVGTGVDSLGYKYGFHVIKSLDAPWFPELPDPHIVRARMMLCCIYRQIESGVVDCYMKGVFDLGGELIDMIAYNTAADTLLGISKTVECAEAKKLTVRMILEQRRRLKSFHQPSSTRLASSRSSGGLGTLYSVDRSTSTTRSEEDLEDQVDRYDDDRDDVCAVCNKQQSVLSKIGSKWDRCRICRAPVCSKCHVRKTVFARPRQIKVSCCMVCVIAARELRVDPRDPYPVIGHMIHDDTR